MGNTTNTATHTAAAIGGGTFGAALLAILVGQFHMEAGIAGAWIVVVGTILAGPVLAWLTVRAQSDPALKAALDAIVAINQQRQATDGSARPAEVEATVTATGTAPPTATVVATTAPPPSTPPVVTTIPTPPAGATP